MSSDTDLQILPVSDCDRGSQKCRLGAKILLNLNAKLGTPALIKIQDGVKYLCTLWPRSDKYNSFIQPSNLVRVLENKRTKEQAKFEFLSFENIECISQVGILSEAKVDLIVKDYTNVIHWRRQNPDVEFKVKSSLRNQILCDNAEVDIDQTQIGQLFGLAYIKVKQLISDNVSGVHCGKFTSGTRIIVDSVLCSERYEQLRMMPEISKLGGLEREMTILKELVELPMKYKTKLGPNVVLPQGILLQGPPGCGKSSLVRQLARECGAFLHTINGPEIFASRPGETEHNLRTAFEKVEIISCEGSCILFLDEIDSICPSHSRGGVERRIVSQLLGLIDHMTSVDHVTVIGATNNPSILDPAIRRPGRLEEEILIGIPNMDQRESILQTLTTYVPMSPEVDLPKLAESTPGYVGADLLSLIQQAHHGAVAEWRKRKQGSLLVRADHLKAALHSIVPSTQRGSDILVDYKPIAWNQIGGLNEVKDKLKQAVEWPLKYPEAFQRLGLPRPRGILLYGPPGCAKTTLVRAAATSCHVTFLAISGGQLYSPYVGDSERKLTQVFQQARAGAPSILFIDELDSVIGNRGDGNKGKGVQERVLSTLLNEMDGIGMKTDDLVRSKDRIAEGQGNGKNLQKDSSRVDNQDVLLIAATNRPDMLDDAILRPGRIDRMIYVPPPDHQARVNILGVHTQNVPLENVDLEDLASKTERFTGADLENLCREAALHALSRDGLDTSSINQAHFDHVLQTQKPSLTSKQLEQYGEIKNSLQLKSS